MVHIAIVPELDKDKTEWLQPVTDEEFNSYQPFDLKQDKEIKLTETAVKNHEELWPNYISKAKRNRP